MPGGPPLPLPLNPPPLDMLTDLAYGRRVRDARRHQQDCCRCRLIVTESNLLLDSDTKCHTHLKQHVIRLGWSKGRVSEVAS